MTLIANSNGEITGKFTIPPNVPAGSKLVEFIGSATRASASFVGRGTLKTEELRMVTTKVNRRTLEWVGDPLAQTFMLERDVQISAVDLWFTAVGLSNVLIQIREVQLGIPSPEVVAESILSPGQINVNNWTRFHFPPVVLDAGKEYAIVAACNDATSALAIAELGKFDANQQKWVTSQPYTVGVLLSSSNNRTWTPHQDKDLTFRLIAADYTVITNDVNGEVVSKDVALPTVSVTDADHLIVMAAVERPEGTDVVFELNLGGTTYTVAEGQPLTLPSRYSGDVIWKAVLIGTPFVSPVLHRDVHLVSGKRMAESDYVTRALQAGADSTITVYYESYTPGGSSIDCYAQSGEDSWEPIPIDEGIQLGDGWVDVKRVLEDFDEDQTRIKLVLNGTANARPRVRNLRVVIT